MERSFCREPLDGPQYAPAGLFGLLHSAIVQTRTSRTRSLQTMNLIRRAKEAVDIPLIGSLNGVSAGGWTDYAALIEEAGADAIELNVYYIPTNENLKGTEIENIYFEILRDVKSSVSIPIAIKLSPFFSATANTAKRLVEEGANGLAL